MVGIISFFNSIRFRLLLVMIIVISALIFQTLFLLSTLEKQNIIENETEKNLKIDTSIFANISELREVLDSIEREQISSILGDFLFQNQLDTSAGVVNFNKFTELVKNIGNSIQERENSGYSINFETNNTLYNIISSFQNNDFGGYGLNPIIDNSETGAKKQYDGFNSTLYENRTTGILYLPSAYILDSRNIRIKHNQDFNQISPAIRNKVQEAGILPFIKYVLNDIRDLLSNSSDPDADEIQLLFIDEVELINQYVILTSRFEKTVLGSSEFTQDEINILIEEFQADLQSLFNSAESINQDINTLTTNSTVLDNAKLINTIFVNANKRVTNGLDNNVQLLRELVENSRNTIITINQKLLIEQAIFNIKVDLLLNSLDQDLQNVNSVVSLIIFFTILIITGSTSLILIKNLNRYQRNYGKIEVGNLRIALKKRYSSNELGKVDQGFDNMITELKRILSVLQRSSERMAGIAEELAAGSEEASASVQEVSNTVREFSMGAAEQNSMLSRVDDKLREHLITIEDANRQINETSHFVLKVAQRTNVLGLNASIQAAKAGKFGRGFNVVAQEVRKLSNDTKASALEIAELVQNIEIRIQSTVRDILNEVNITKDVAENTAAGSEEANAATSEQVVMLNEISQTSNELSLLANELQEVLARFEL